jgi:hypothetical protein
VVQLRWQKVALDRGQLVSEVAIISLNLYKTLEIELLLLGERTLVTKGVKLHAEALFHILHRSDVLPSIVGTHWLIRSWRLRLNDVDLRPTVLFHELLVGHLNKHVVIYLVRTASRVPLYPAILLWHLVLRLFILLCCWDDRGTTDADPIDLGDVCQSLVHDFDLLYALTRTHLILYVLGKLLL